MINSLQPYSEYKKVVYDYAHELPKDWQLLPNIAIFQERIERGHDNEELLSVTIGKGVIKQIDVDIKKDSSNENKSKYKLVKIGDIAYNKMRMWQGALGYSEYQGISSPAYVILKPKMEINSRYFHYMLRTNFYTNYSKRFSYGIVDDQLSLRYTDFKRMYSIAPPLETQNTIVEYLDKKNAAIEKFIKNKERLIELLEEEKKSTIYRHCKEFFITNKKKIKFVAKICNGFEQKTVEAVNGKFPIYGSGGIIGYANKCIYDNTSVLLGRKGTIDKPILITEPFWVIDTAFYTIINEKKIIPKFFLFACSFINFDEYKYGSAIPSITQGMLHNIEIPVPDIKTQQKLITLIENYLQKINIAISKAQKEITLIKEYRQSLITDLVLGKLCINNSLASAKEIL